MEVQALEGSTPSSSAGASSRLETAPGLNPGEAWPLGVDCGGFAASVTPSELFHPKSRVEKFTSESTPSRSATQFVFGGAVLHWCQVLAWKASGPDRGLGVRFPPPPQRGARLHILGDVCKWLATALSMRRSEFDSRHPRRGKADGRPGPVVIAPPHLAPPNESHDLVHEGSIPSPATQARCCR